MKQLKSISAVFLADLYKAVEVAHSVNGVKSVKNDMRLK